jgi:hypothetical protein
MHRRALHLASLLLLLTTLGIADGSASRDGDYSLGGHYITVLLAQQEATAVAHISFDPGRNRLTDTALPATSLAQVNTAWTMRPSAAHSISTHAVTGSGL